jgi:hypothetical protein
MEQDANAKRLALAGAVAGVYGAHPDVVAMVLCGSVARGWADAWSDVELLVCWSSIAPADERARLARAAGGTSRQSWPIDPELGVIEEPFVRDGIKVDLLHVASASIDAVLEAVTVGADPSPRKHVLVAAIRDGVALAGKNRLDAWQARAAVYPLALRVAVIEQNLIFGPHWWLEMLAARGDLLPLSDLLARIGRAVLGIVHALNDTYALSNDGKWSLRMAASLPLAPDDFPGRLARMLSAPAIPAVAEATALIDETIGLVARHCPEVDVGPVRARVARPRAEG